MGPQPGWKLTQAHSGSRPRAQSGSQTRAHSQGRSRDWARTQSQSCHCIDSWNERPHSLRLQLGTPK